MVALRWRDRLTARLDEFVPPEALLGPEEELRRIRLGIVVSLLMVPVFLLLGVTQTLADNPIAGSINFVLMIPTGAAPWLIRSWKRFDLVLNVVLTVAFLGVVSLAVFARGGGLSAATVALAEVPLFAILLGGLRTGVLWASVCTVASIVLAVLEARGLIHDQVPIESRLLNDQVALVIILWTLFLVGVIFEARKNESLRNIARLEETRRIKEQDRLRVEAEADLLRNERHAAMGRMASAVAHEINNPLTYLSGNLELLREELRDLPAEAMTLLDEALSGAGRIRRLVNDLQLLEAGDDEVVKSVDVHLVLRRAAELAATQTRARVEVHWDLGADAWVAGNQARLAQLFLQLILNAALPSAEGHAPQGAIRIATRRHEDTVTIEVHDSGTGLAAEEIDRLGEPLFSARNLGRGRGLGLTLADVLVRRLGGTLSVESRPGRTVVCVAMPASSPTAPSPVADLPVDRLVSSSPRPRILIVDDEPLVAKMLGLAVREHHVEIATSGRDALRLLRQQPPYDLVLCDLMMPDLTGMDVYEARTKEDPSGARNMVFMSGGVFTDRGRAFRASVPNPILSKPVSVETIRQLVAACTEVKGERTGSSK